MAGGQGGARPGAGRKKGQTKAAIAARDARADIDLRHGNLGIFDADVLDEDPLDTMEFYRRTMRQMFADAVKDGKPDAALGFLKESANIAREVAPYFHGKQSHVVTENISSNPAEGKSSAELMTDVFGPTARANDTARPN